MTSVLLELIRHKTWATHKLIALCESLDPALVDSTAPGTYGTIRKTLVHLVNADRSYYRRLCGEQPWQRMDEDTTQLATIVERFDEIVAGWEELAADNTLPERDVHFPNGELVKGSAIFAQSLHHGDVHRAHVLSILGSHQLEVPELDLWEYAFELGLATPPSE
jgi:uncharacterized damage-inducible protein DinB